jgi:plasmid maintenance system antidote protein VapI
VSEVLSGKRALSKKMICLLVDGLGIPAELLLDIKQYSQVKYSIKDSAMLRVAEK